MNSEGRKLFNKNNNKYFLEEDNNNDKEIEKLQDQNTVRKERIRTKEGGGH
jgi:hypothetical protein